MEHHNEEKPATAATVNGSQIDLLWTAIETESNILPTADEQAAKMLCRRFGVPPHLAPLIAQLAGFGDCDHRRAA
jgi:hypothetical protein